MPGTIEHDASPVPLVEGPHLDSIPKEVGVMLIAAGIGGILLPGPIGAPILVLGGAVFFPNLFRKLDRGLAKRFPKLHREGMKQVNRFLRDLEKRYPTRS